MGRRFKHDAIVGLVCGAVILGLMSRGTCAELSVPGSAGLYGGSEIMFFKPFAEAGSLPNEILMATGADDFLPAWRLWGGVVGDDSFGTRIRWWQYDQFSENAEANSSRVVFQKLDWEFTQQVSMNRWDVLFSGGLTYVGNQVSETFSPTSPFVDSALRFRFDGVGVTVGVQAFRHSSLWPSATLGGGIQWSGVYGNSVGMQSGLFPRNFEQRSLQGTTGSILELAVGPRWEREVGNGAVAFIGCNAEAQLWMTGLGATSYSLLPVYVRAGDVGLVGLTINAGIRR